MLQNSMLIDWFAKQREGLMHQSNSGQVTDTDRPEERSIKRDYSNLTLSGDRFMHQCLLHAVLFNLP